MRTLLLTLLLLCTALLVPKAQAQNAQACDYTLLMKQGDALYAKQDYRAALKKYNAARICDPGQGAAVDVAIDKLFTAIEKQRDEAKRQRARAEEALKVVEAEKQKTLKEKNRADSLLIITQAEKNRADSLLQVSNTALARAEAALLAVEEATVQIVQTLLRDAQEEIRLLRYESSLIKLHSAARLVQGKAPGSPLDQIRPTLGQALMEPAYYFAETGQYDMAAPDLRLADSLLAGGAASAWTLTPLAGDTLARYRETLAALDSAAYHRLRLRYYPDMATVPGGTFWMGDNERDAIKHQVTLDTFQIARTELTFWQHHLYLQATGARKLEDLGPLSWGFNGDHPVVNVSWYDAVAYLNWLSARSGLQPAYEIRGEEDVVILPQRNGYRLPTEAEWEYAAGGGLTDRDAKGRLQYTYAGSDSIDAVAWYRDNASNRTQPVARKQPNGLGLYDLGGNVWEWCQDWYGDYPAEAQTNPQGPVAGSYRVLRGGSWSSRTGDCRGPSRDSGDPVNRYFYFGFRPTRTP